MKTIKRIISLVLTAVILVTTMCVGTVTASAESKLSVKFYDDSKYYYVRVSGISSADYEAAMKNSSKTMCPYVCVLYLVGDTLFGMGNLQYETISSHAFLVDDKEMDFDTKGYYKYVSSNDTYRFYFRMPKSNKNAKKYMPMAKNIEVLSGFFGLYDTASGNMYSAYKKEYELQFITPTVDYGSYSTTTSTEKKKLSSLKFEDVANYTYTGKARKPAVTIYDGSYKLKSGTDYTLSYKNNKEIGEATITVTGKGKYTGTKTIKFKIVPKKPEIKVSKKSSKITVSWGEIAGAEKYQIYCSVNGGKYKRIATTSKTSYSTSKLNVKDDLKFKVRAYTEVDDVKYYGSLSKVVALG